MSIKFSLLFTFALFILAWLGVPVVEFGVENPIESQIGYLSSSNPVYRLLAKGSLVNSGDKAVPFLLNALEEEDVQTKIEVAQVLGFIGNPKAIDPLIKLFDHEYWRVRFFSIDAFRDLKAKKIIPKLKSKIVHDENNDVRQISLLVLGKMEEFDDVEFLKSLLKNEELYSSHFKAEVNRMIKKIESRILR